MKLLGCILLITLNSILAKSQEYIPFDFDNGEWYCRYETKGGLFGGGHGINYATDSVKFFCSGDTTVNDTLYKKLYYIGNTSSENVKKTYISGYYGAIRNDILKKQVWFYVDNKSFLKPYIGNGSFLMYDFNIINGDSMCNAANYPLPLNFYFCGKLESIDSLRYCNKYFRKYNLDHYQSIIEGIGSDKGLFPGPWQSNLLCYMEKSNGDCERCNLNFTSINYNTLNDDLINIIQKNNDLQISSNYIIESVELVDLSGRYILKADGIGCNSANIYVNQMGIYIIKVKIDNKILSRKIFLE